MAASAAPASWIYQVMVKSMTAANKLRKKHTLEIWLAGILMAIPLSIPVVNLLVPLLGVAVFTHQFHRIYGQNK